VAPLRTRRRPTGPTGLLRAPWTEVAPGAGRLRAAKRGAKSQTQLRWVSQARPRNPPAPDGAPRNPKRPRQFLVGGWGLYLGFTGALPGLYSGAGGGRVGSELESAEFPAFGTRTCQHPRAQQTNYRQIAGADRRQALRGHISERVS